MGDVALYDLDVYSSWRCLDFRLGVVIMLEKGRVYNGGVQFSAEFYSWDWRTSL